MERIKSVIILLIITTIVHNILAAENPTGPGGLLTESVKDIKSPMLYQTDSVTSHKLHFECGTEENRHVGKFTYYDYSIVIGMLVISLGIGVFYGFFNASAEDTTSDFLHGSEMSLLTVTLSLTTSFITAIELLGNPSEMTFMGTQFSLIGKYFKVFR